MLKRFGIPSIALATVLAIAAPGLTLARGRDDFRGGTAHPAARIEQRNDRLPNRGRVALGVNVYTPVPTVVEPVAPIVTAPGYYDQYGIWHAGAYCN